MQVNVWISGIWPSWMKLIDMDWLQWWCEYMSASLGVVWVILGWRMQWECWFVRRSEWLGSTWSRGCRNCALTMVCIPSKSYISWTKSRITLKTLALAPSRCVDAFWLFIHLQQAPGRLLTPFLPLFYQHLAFSCPSHAWLNGLNNILDSHDQFDPFDSSDSMDCMYVHSVPVLTYTGAKLVKWRYGDKGRHFSQKSTISVPNVPKDTYWCPVSRNSTSRYVDIHKSAKIVRFQKYTTKGGRFPQY